MFYLLLIVTSIKVEILPSYSGISVNTIKYFTDDLIEYGLETDIFEGTYAFFYFQSASQGEYTQILELSSLWSSISTIGIGNSCFYSSWGSLTADIRSPKANLLNQWMLIILSISYAPPLQLDFTIFINNQQLSLSVQDYFAAIQEAFSKTSYFVIGGHSNNGIIHSLNLFTSPENSLILSQYLLLSPFQTNIDSFFMLNVIINIDSCFYWLYRTTKYKWYNSNQLKRISLR